MSRFALLFMLIPFLLSMQVSASTNQFEPGFDACQILADDDGESKKKDKKEGEGEEEEPDCD